MSSISGDEIYLNFGKVDNKKNRYFVQLITNIDLSQMTHEHPFYPKSQEVYEMFRAFFVYMKDVRHIKVDDKCEFKCNQKMFDKIVKNFLVWYKRTQ